MPFVFISVVYILVTVLLTHLKIPVPVVPKFLVISSALVVTLAISTFSMKISAHAIGVAGLCRNFIGAGCLFIGKRISDSSNSVYYIKRVSWCQVVCCSTHTINEVTWGGIWVLLWGSQAFWYHFNPPSHSGYSPFELSLHSMDFQLLKYETTGGLARITLNRPRSVQCVQWWFELWTSRCFEASSKRQCCSCCWVDWCWQSVFSAKI